MDPSTNLMLTERAMATAIMRVEESKIDPGADLLFLADAKGITILPTTGTLPDAGVIWTDGKGGVWRCRSRFKFDNNPREGCCMWPYRAKKTTTAAPVDKKEEATA